MAGNETVDVVVVGAGFGGLYLLHRLRVLGFSVVVVEAGDDVGGTWFWNRYPGARCDVESLEYSYSFDADLAQDWHWSERYAAQPEILAYARHVADRFDLRRDLRCSTRVSGASFDEGSERWMVHSDAGDTWSAQWLVLATGCLSSANVPDLPGLREFAGVTVHTGRWPRDPVDVVGKRVAVVGTGSSAIQAVPLIAREASEVTVFQRTATYAVPARNRPTDVADEASVKADYPAFRAANQRMSTAFGARLGGSG
ncbi:MAG: NAD(P)/FAD-dependent oxidoreductase [Actinomycetes bacterium]